MKDSQRISVRLSHHQLAELRVKCQQAGCSVSQTTRRALDAFLGCNVRDTAALGTRARQEAPTPHRTTHIGIPLPSSICRRTQEEQCEAMAVGTPISLVQPAAVKSEILAYELPKTLTDQLTRFRAFGMELRKERRRL